MTAFDLSAHAARVLQERGIAEAWVARAMAPPQRTAPDPSDPTALHALLSIREFGGRVLRVVDNQHIKPPRIVTAFFDRSIKGRL